MRLSKTRTAERTHFGLARTTTWSGWLVQKPEGAQRMQSEKLWQSVSAWAAGGGSARQVSLPARFEGVSLNIGA